MHICPDEIWMFMMAMPFIGSAVHWLRHKWKKTRCRSDDQCLPQCEHPPPVEVFDPLDP